MREFQEKNKLDRLLYSKVVIGLLSVVLFVFLNALWGTYSKYNETKESREVALKGMGELKEREEAIKKEIERLKSYRGVEEEIRKKFGFVKAGERVIVITESVGSTDNSSEGPGENLLGNLWSSISGIFYKD